MNKQIPIDGLPPKESSTNDDKKQKRRWENGFQRWSNKQSQDGLTYYGKCGYGSMCDYCLDVGKGRPCVRALNEMCRDREITIDYNNRNYQDIWEI